MGQPLNHQLTSRGARFAGTVATSADYRLHRLGTTPERPGLVRVESGGESIEAERWLMPPAGLGALMTNLPPGLAIGPLRLADNSEPLGFLCEHAALAGAEDITSYGSWTAYLESRPVLG
jgi:allophanate hydrolase